MSIEPAFVIPVYLDDRYATRLIQAIRIHYPSAPLLVIADGDHNPMFVRFVQDQGGFYHLGHRLKPVEFGAAWTIRMLELMQRYLQGVLWIKLDADAMLYRPIDFEQLSYPFDMAGSVHFLEDFAYTRGGCRIYNHDAVNTILRSELLQDPKYAQGQRWGYLRYCPRYKLPGDPPGTVLESLHAEDFVLGDVCSQLGLKLIHFPDFCIHFREPLPENSHRNYSVVHPVR